MREYVLDANAVIRYLRPGAGGDRVEALFEQASKGYTNLLISAINLGEVFYILLRYMDESSVRGRLAAMEPAITIVEANTTRALEAALVKHRYRLGYADSFAAALSLERNATLVSADPEFERCGRTLKWMRLPPFES